MVRRHPYSAASVMIITTPSLGVRMFARLVTKKSEETRHEALFLAEGGFVHGERVFEGEVVRVLLEGVGALQSGRLRSWRAAPRT